MSRRTKGVAARSRNRTRQSSVENAHVFHAPACWLDTGDVLALCQGANHFVAADGEAVGAVIEAKRLSRIDEGQDRATQGGVTVDVVFADCQVPEGLLGNGEVVNGAFHCRADVHEYESRCVLVKLENPLQISIVHLAVLLGAHLDPTYLQQPQRLGHAVVRVLRIVDNAMRPEFPGQVQSVDISLGATVGDVAPR